MFKERSIINKRKNNRIDLSKIYENHIDTSLLTPENIINILKKLPYDRDLRDYSILNDYILTKSKLTEKFRQQKIPQSTYEKIILLSLSSCKLKIFLSSKSQIYTPEVDANYLYIILKGSAKIIKIHKNLIKMKPYDYYKLLINYRNNKNEYLLKNTIAENNAIYPIDINDINNIEKILLKIYIIDRKEEINDYDYLDRLLKKVGLKYADFGLKYSYKEELKIKNELIQKSNLESINLGRGFKFRELLHYNAKDAEQYVLEQERIIYDDLNFITYEICQKYIYLCHEDEKFVTKFELIDDKILKSNDYFGDYFKKKYIDFVESAEDNLYLLMIKNNMINDIINNEKQKISENQSDFLVNNFFFRSIQKFNFEKYYINFFEIESYHSGQKICNENDSVKYLYFIKKGRVRLYYYKTILEIHSLINIIKEQIKQKKLEENENESKNNKNKENEIIKFIEDNQNYKQLYGDVESIKSELNIKREKNIIIYQENKCLGFESFYYGLKYLYSAKAISDKVEIYKLSITQLARIFNNNNDRCYLDLAKKAEQTLFFLMKRFIKINNLLLNFCEKRKIMEDEKTKLDIMENQKNNPPEKIIYNNNKLCKKIFLIKKAEISKLLPRLENGIKRSKIIDNLSISNDSSIQYNKLPSLNLNDILSEKHNKYDNLNQSNFEKNNLNINTERSSIGQKNKYNNLKKQIFQKKLSPRQSNLFITSSKIKINNLNFNFSRDNSINSSYYKKESKNSNNSCMPCVNKENIFDEDISDKQSYYIYPYFFNQNKQSSTQSLLPFNSILNQRKLIGEKQQRLINIKKKLLLKNNKIYKEQKQKMSSMVNNYFIEE